MSIHAKGQLANGLILLCGALLLSACANKTPPVSITEEPPISDMVAARPMIAESASDLELSAELSSDSSPDSDSDISSESTQSVDDTSEQPETYIVQKGDTLWDISAHFLQAPWYWPEIWFKNQQIENPHLIYPGDVLSIVYVNNQKRIQIQRRGGETTIKSGIRVVKLKPRVRSKAIDATIPIITIESIRHLLARSVIMDKALLDNSAYVIASIDDHLMNSTNDTLYVRRLDNTSSTRQYKIVRPNKEINDPITGEFLGYEALYVGEAYLLKHGDPSKLLVNNSVREILQNDRIIAFDNSDIMHNFYPKPPANEVRGRVISLVDAISQIGNYQTVALNLGSRDGVKPGSLLNIKREGDTVRGTDETDPDFKFKLPDETIGVAMVINAYEKMSYALVMQASRPVSIKDYVEATPHSNDIPDKRYTQDLPLMADSSTESFNINATPKAVEPKATALKNTEPKTVEPKAAAIKNTKPKAVEPKAAALKNTKPKTVEPKTGFYLGLLYSKSTYSEKALPISFNPNVASVRFGKYFQNNFAAEGRIGFGTGSETKKNLGVDIKYDVDSYIGIYALKHFDITNSLSIYGALGVTQGQSKTTISIPGRSLSGTAKDSDLSFGAGAQFSNFNIEFMQYTNKSKYKFSAISLGIVF